MVKVIKEILRPRPMLQILKQREQFTRTTLKEVIWSVWITSLFLIWVDSGLAEVKNLILHAIVVVLSLLMLVLERLFSNFKLDTLPKKLPNQKWNLNTIVLVMVLFPRNIALTMVKSLLLLNFLFILKKEVSPFLSQELVLSTKMLLLKEP